jgi:hypothetical protein
MHVSCCRALLYVWITSLHTPAVLYTDTLVVDEGKQVAHVLYMFAVSLRVLHAAVSCLHEHLPSFSKCPHRSAGAQ